MDLFYPFAHTQCMEVGEGGLYIYSAQRLLGPALLRLSVTEESATWTRFTGTAAEAARDEGNSRSQQPGVFCADALHSVLSRGEYSFPADTTELLLVGSLAAFSTTRILPSAARRYSLKTAARPPRTYLVLNLRAAAGEPALFLTSKAKTAPGDPARKFCQAAFHHVQLKDSASTAWRRGLTLVAANVSSALEMPDLGARSLVEVFVPCNMSSRQARLARLPTRLALAPPLLAAELTEDALRDQSRFPILTPDAPPDLGAFAELADAVDLHLSPVAVYARLESQCRGLVGVRLPALPPSERLLLEETLGDLVLGTLFLNPPRLELELGDGLHLSRLEIARRAFVAWQDGGEEEEEPPTLEQVALIFGRQRFYGDRIVPDAEEEEGRYRPLGASALGLGLGVSLQEQTRLLPGFLASLGSAVGAPLRLPDGSPLSGAVGYALDTDAVVVTVRVAEGGARAPCAIPAATWQEDVLGMAMRRTPASLPPSTFTVYKGNQPRGSLVPRGEGMVRLTFGADHIWHLLLHGKHLCKLSVCIGPPEDEEVARDYNPACADTIATLALQRALIYSSRSRRRNLQPTIAARSELELMMQDRGAGLLPAQQPPPAGTEAAQRQLAAERAAYEGLLSTHALSMLTITSFELFLACYAMSLRDVAALMGLNPAIFLEISTHGNKLHDGDTEFLPTLREASGAFFRSARQQLAQGAWLPECICELFQPTREALSATSDPPRAVTPIVSVALGLLFKTPQGTTILLDKSARHMHIGQRVTERHPGRQPSAPFATSLDCMPDLEWGSLFNHELSDPTEVRVNYFQFYSKTFQKVLPVNFANARHVRLVEASSPAETSRCAVQHLAAGGSAALACTQNRPLQRFEVTLTGRGPAGNDTFLEELEKTYNGLLCPDVPAHWSEDPVAQRRAVSLVLVPNAPLVRGPAAALVMITQAPLALELSAIPLALRNMLAGSAATAAACMAGFFRGDASFRTPRELALLTTQAFGLGACLLGIFGQLQGATATTGALWPRMWTGEARARLCLPLPPSSPGAVPQPDRNLASPLARLRLALLLKAGTLPTTLADFATRVQAAQAAAMAAASEALSNRLRVRDAARRERGGAARHAAEEEEHGLALPHGGERGRGRGRGGRGGGRGRGGLLGGGARGAGAGRGRGGFARGVPRGRARGRSRARGGGRRPLEDFSSSEEEEEEGEEEEQEEEEERADDEEDEDATEPEQSSSSEELTEPEGSDT